MAITLPEIEQFLYREARYLDDREFDKWLECYAPDCEFWMPAWDDDDTLVTDPEREISSRLSHFSRVRNTGLLNQKTERETFGTLN
jgi:3-phenylpropionate/cinnamic acid dioxygenase small subunit